MAFEPNIEINSLGIGTFTPSDYEAKKIHAVAREIYDSVITDPTDHAGTLDKLEGVGPEVIDCFPELAEVLSKHVSRTALKATVLKLPMDPEAAAMLPPTPQEYLAPGDNPIHLAAVPRLIAITALGLRGYGYDSQQPFNVINNVIAIRSMAGVNGASANASDALGLHTEDASYNLGGALLPNGERLPEGMNLSPDWLTINFFRNPDAIPTFIAAPDLDQLPDRLLDALYSPYFHNATNPGQQFDGNSNDSRLPVSIAYEGEAGRHYLRANMADLSVVEGAPGVAREAYDAFLQLLQESEHDLETPPGSIVLIHNRRVLHGRRNYGGTPPRWDGADRWQQRLVATDNDGYHTRPYEVRPRIVSPHAFMQNVERLTNEALQAAE